jgi:uncharacterized membrane protein YecN with MAPEG domain
MPRVTALYAGLLLVVFLAITWRALVARQRSGVVLGAGADRRLERAMRVQANFVEYVPLFLVALLAAELCGAEALALHAAGGAMAAGRTLHAAGMSREPDIVALRAAGMLLTLGALLLATGLVLRAGLGL